jgi:carboxyl-terminal processing protease
MPPALFLFVLFLAALVPLGCTAFERGSYWPRYQSRLSDGAASIDDVPAGTAPDWSDATRAEAIRRRLRAAVSRRWSNVALAESARDMAPRAGRYVYGGALRTVVALYVDPVSYRDLVVAGIESLRAALDDETFRDRFTATDDADRRARLAEALEILSLKARATSFLFSWQATEWLDVALEKNRTLLGLPDGAVVAEFLFGATDALDPYTRFMTAEMLGTYERQLKGEYAGIGAAVTQRDGRVFLEEVFDGGAAREAGLEAGDELLRIDDEPVGGLDLSEVSERLRGKRGTEVRVTVRPGGDGEPRTVTLTRTAVRLPSVRRVRLLEGDGAVGYLRVTGFKSGTERELRAAVADLRGRGARRLLVDLRGNPGGSLLEAIGAAGVFLDGGRVVETRGRALGADWSYDVPLFARQAWDGPLVLLVDGGTASAAEALAAALSARGRARLVGRRTYGKGAAQIKVPILGSGTAVTVTVARVYGPDERCLEGEGLAPDRHVPEPDDPPETLADDAAVRAGLDLLRAQALPEAARP